MTVTTNARTKFCSWGDDWIIRRESEKLSKDPLSEPDGEKEKQIEREREEAGDRQKLCVCVCVWEREKYTEKIRK